ncbi:cupin domain-containing protein [Candidatus Gottesmanbacteria bacterium]|nr:cupin domain-containing protein [Candidatus Gottesmanbacteria bacterium]
MKIIHLADIEKAPTSHEDPADPGVVKQILLKHNDLAPGRIQMINWSTFLPGKSFRPHYHEAMDEVFIILDGEVEMRVGKETEQLGKGDAVVVSENAIHVMKNLTDQEVPYIAIGISHGEGGKTVVI